MSIATILAHVSCSDVGRRAPRYEKLFGEPAPRRPMPGPVEWQFIGSTEVQAYEEKEHAGQPLQRSGRAALLYEAPPPLAG